MKNPYLGRSGRFNVMQPFDAIVKPKVVYTVKAYTYLSEHARNGMDAYSAIYKIAGMSRSEYDEDISKDVAILTLVDSSNNTVYIPEYKVLGGCVRDGVEYSDKTLLFNIGGHPNNLDLTTLVNEVSEMITSRLGVTPIGEIITTSITEMVSNQEHINIQNNRQPSIKDNNVTRLNNALSRISELENIINCMVKEKAGV